MNISQILIQNKDLRSDSLGISREQSTLSNVTQSAVEHDDSFETDTDTTVGVSTVFERFDVIFNGIDLNAAFSSSLGQEFRIVNSLSTTGNFFTSHEEIVRVGVSGVILAGHGVERSGGDGVSVENVEIGVVLLLDEVTQLSFSDGIEIFHSGPFDAIFLQKVNTFLEGELNDGSLELEGVEGILDVDGFQFFGESGFQTAENVGKEFTDQVEDFVIVLLNGHFNIQTCEFTHVSVGKTVFGSENWTNFENSVEISHNAHLLVELGRLGEAGFSVEVLHLEDVGTTFGSTGNELGGVDFNESLSV